MLVVLLSLFYLIDSHYFRKESPADMALDASSVSAVKILGKRNFLCLAGIICAVFTPEPWRELIMIAFALLGYRWTPLGYRQKNAFTFLPIAEVAILFAAIFITMVPALSLLRSNAGDFGITKPWQFFWLTGALSSFLDNAPTYLSFVSLAQGLGFRPDVIGISEGILRSISLGAVFMGANTYIGNGPNFMVKTIAEEYKIKAPTFFGYMGYSVLILLPVLFVVTLIFFI
jgi:Na+/H+ antiporter NhaD/arsenite permease-like protein